LNRGRSKLPLSPQVELIAIDADPKILDLIAGALKQPGLNISRFTDALQGWGCIRWLHPDIVILDRDMAQMGGLELLGRIAMRDPAIDVVILSREYSTELAIEAIRRGACDYLGKPIAAARLRERVDLWIQAARGKRLAGRLEGELLDASQYGGMIGHSGSMLEAFTLARRAATHFHTILVTGPAGAGKELMARALHRMSPARERPFIVCNCAAIAKTLFESELFGQARGSPTRSTMDRAGFFELADEGTLFLDEIGEIPLKLQARFLRALQSGEIQQAGSPAPRRVNVRVIAATNRDLGAMVRAHEFREDLFRLLSTLALEIPALADRKEDVPLLCRHFVKHFARQMGKDLGGLTRRAQAVLSRHSWPGNIRELENAIGYACAMAETDLIDITNLPEYIQMPNEANDAGKRLTLEEVERRHVRYILERTGGNKQMAAGILGISRATIYRFLHEQRGSRLYRAEDGGSGPASV
jgi:DNA-binding NtrC family response regulator